MQEWVQLLQQALLHDACDLVRAGQVSSFHTAGRMRSIAVMCQEADWCAST
jgi:hypothetical protein